MAMLAVLIPSSAQQAIFVCSSNKMSLFCPSPSNYSRKIVQLNAVLGELQLVQIC
jgi:hypothetical protein